MVFLQLFVMLIVILIAAEVFTNALEHMGEKLGISEGVTGSIFAAVGTALPETSVPLLAIFPGPPIWKPTMKLGWVQFRCTAHVGDTVSVSNGYVSL